MKKVIAQARAAGIESKYVQTSSLQMYPVYSEEKVPRFLAYEVSQTIQLTLKDLSKYEGLVSKLLQDGVNRIDNLDFQVSDSRKYKDETRLNAIRAAKEKATAMAAELGQTIGKPWEVEEEADPATLNGYNYYANATAFGRTRAPAEFESTVAPGQITIRSSVRVSFQLD